LPSAAAAAPIPDKINNSPTNVVSRMKKTPFRTTQTQLVHQPLV
jgi:hypothetical protein